MELPQGLTPEVLKNIQDFMASQPAKQEYVRPSGLLKSDQVRGVNPRYRYEYREYPKALTPPKITIRDANHERQLRNSWHMPLPWGTDDDGKALTANYYAEAVYPRDVQPPQIVVNNAQEEAAKLAEWRVDGSGAKGSVYPKWLFHAEKGGQMVSSRDAEIALGGGWFDTPAGALASLKKEAASASDSLDGLRETAVALGIGVDKRWGEKRLRDEIESAEAAKDKVAA